MSGSRSEPSAAAGAPESPTARSASGLWTTMNAQYECFEDYERRTDRSIAVFVLEPR